MIHLRSPQRSLLLPMTLALLSATAPADRVVTEDGRVLEVKKAREEGDGYRLVFEHGEIVLPDRSAVKAVEVEGDMSEYEPKNDDERAKLEQGYVRFEGKWMSKGAYQNLLRKRHEKSKERADLLAAHAEFANGWTAETRHFAIRTNTSPELLEYYGELLEAYYKLMDDRIGIKPTPTYRRKKMAVNIYKSHEEFTKLSGVDSPSVLGFFSPSEDSLNFFHDYQEPARSDWVALHECTHLLTFLIDQDYIAQIWLNEAVADYLGSATITRDKRGRIEIESGTLQTDRVLTVQQAMADGKHIPLDDLFKIAREQFHGFQYAHAWSFVYFLNEYDGGKYARDFWRFFHDLYTLGKGIDFDIVNYATVTGTGKIVRPEVIREVLLDRLGHEDTTELEAQWKAFIQAIPVDAPAARLKRGLRALNEGRFDAALSDLDAAIDGGAADPRGYWARGRARIFSGDPKNGLEDLRRAVERDPLNASFRYDLSQVLHIYGRDETKAEALVQAGLATELAPDNDGYAQWLTEVAESE